VICPKCGEVNSSNFLFCGMCGTILSALTVHTPRTTESIATANSGIVTAPAAVPAPPPPPARPRSAPDEPTPPISGPSLLGLDQGNVDVLRERAFSSLASYAQPEEPRSGGKEALLTILLLAALGAAGWWTYKNYIGVTSRKPTPVVTAPASDASASAPAQTQTPAAASKPEDKTSEQKAPTEPPATENQGEKAATPAEEKPPVTKSELADSKTADTKTAAAAEAGSKPKAATPAAAPSRHEVSAERVPAAKAGDSGEAFFRQGEGYLYGRGGAGNCANAIKYLKMASDKQHAKARSAMGTMYATGHCVPRDLPSSYHWFALALQADPNNTIVEKNLRALWNQMTPPERQLATKSQ
jgi:outer membrane biosynthesis protein TonB